MNIENKFVLVTGASSGIGREFCRAFARKGGIPVLVARRENRLNELADELKSEFGTEALVYPADLLEDGAVSRMKEFLEGKKVEIEILVNNAGFGFKGPFEKPEFSEYNRMMQLNMNILTELCYAFLPGMRERKSGGVINVASMAGIGPVPYFGVYAATKAYVVSLSQALWKEYEEHGVHVSALCPGPVDTEFFEVAGADPGLVPGRSLQTPEEVVEKAIEGLNKNKRVVPTSTSLRALYKISGVIPAGISLSASAAIMKK